MPPRPPRLALSNTMPLALAVEGFVTVAGLWLYLSGLSSSRWRKAGVVVLTALVMAMTVVGTTVAPAPPSNHASRRLSARR